MADFYPQREDFPHQAQERPLGNVQRRVPHAPSPPAPRPSTPASPPPTHPVSPASPSVSEGHMSTPTFLPPYTDRTGTPNEDTDVESCSYKLSQSSLDDDSSRDSPSVSPSASPAITLSEEEEEEKKKGDPSYELRSGRGRSRARGPGASVHAHGRAVVLSAMIQWITSA